MDNNKLLFINACIRKDDSRTLRLAQPMIDKLKENYEIAEVNLCDSEMRPIISETCSERLNGNISSFDIVRAKKFAEADRIVVAAPFWDMSFPAILKTYFEHISISGITFNTKEDGTTEGNCKSDKLLYITTRGLNIPDNDYRDQATSYLKALGWLWGISKIYTVSAYGLDIIDETSRNGRIVDAIARGLKICEKF